MKVGDLVRCKVFFDGNLGQLGVITRLGNRMEDPDTDAFWTGVYVLGYGEHRRAVKIWEVINESG